MRRLYIGAVLPRTLYCTSAWYIPPGEPGHCRRTIQVLENIQCRAARLIMGAFRVTSKPALDIELFLLPAEQWLTRAAGEALLCIASAHEQHGLHEVMSLGRNRGLNNKVSPHHPGPLEQLFHHFRYLLMKAELNGI